MSAATTGKTGIGVLLKMGDGESPEVMTTVANVTQMSVGGVTVNMADATHLDSPNFYTEFLPALKTAEEWTLTLQWDPTHATHDATTGLRKKMEDRTLTTFQVDPGAIGLATGFEADCYVSNLGNVDVSPQEVMTQSCTLRPSGKPREQTFAVS